MNPSAAHLMTMTDAELRSHREELHELMMTEHGHTNEDRYMTRKALIDAILADRKAHAEPDAAQVAAAEARRRQPRRRRHTL